MRLFLSSENVGNYPEVFLKMLGKNKRLAFVHNAIDDWSPEERTEKVKKHEGQLRSQGFDPVDLDLRDYFGKAKELRDFLKGCGGIFLFGGNTFILRRAMAYSGLDEILKEMIINDEIAYGGSSAGAIIPTPSLRGSEHGDHPETVPEGYKDEIIWEGLNLVSFYIVPHYKSDWWGKEADQMIDYLIDRKFDYHALKDGQVYIIDGDKQELLK